MSCKVAILGGGVGGLAPHMSLIERGFAVSVFERSNGPRRQGAEHLCSQLRYRRNVSPCPVSMASDSFPRFISICQTP